MQPLVARAAFVAASPLALTPHAAPPRATSFAPPRPCAPLRPSPRRARILTPPTPSPAPAPRMQMRPSGGGNGGGLQPPIADRVLSILPYLIPLLDSLSFGSFVFAKVPLLSKLLLRPLIPLYQIYRGVPLLAFGVFLALYTLVRNPSISRYIRFNICQALIIDIALILPQLFQGVRLPIPTSVAEVCSTAVFYAAALAVAYAVVCNVQGRAPDDIPGISDSVQQQIGPY